MLDDSDTILSIRDVSPLAALEMNRAILLEKIDINIAIPANINRSVTMGTIIKVISIPTMFISLRVIIIIGIANICADNPTASGPLSF